MKKIACLLRSRWTSHRSSVVTVAAVVVCIAMSYVHNSAQSLLYVPRANNTVLVYTTNTDGTLTADGTVTTGLGSGGLVMRGDEAFAYVTSESADIVVPIDTKTRALGTARATGNGPFAVAITPNGSRVYVANTFDDNVSLYDAAPLTGELTFASTFSAGCVSPMALATNASGSRLYVLCDASDTLAAFDISGSSPLPLTSASTGATPTALAVHPNGNFVYVTNGNSDNLTAIDTTSDANVAVAGSPFATGSNPQSVAVTPDGNYLYLVNSGDANISAYQVNTTTGALLPVAGSPFAAGTTPRRLVIAPDVPFLYVKDSAANQIRAFSIAGSGALTSVGTVPAASVGNAFALSVMGSNGNKMLASGVTFVANTAGALKTTGAGGAVFTGGTLRINGTDLAIDTPMTLQSTSGTIDTNGNNATISSVITGGVPVALTKTGTGTLTLTGTNTYLGSTSVTGGTLRVNGSITSNVNVASGGTLQGTGTVRNVTVFSGGVLSPGNSPGTLNTQILVVSTGGTLQIELNGTTAGTQYDQVNVTGTVSLQGDLQPTLGFTPAVNSVFTIINNDGSEAVGGTFNGLAEGSTFTLGGHTFKVSYVGGTGNDVTLEVVTDVGISKTGASTIVAGTELTYTITASNTGSDDAQAITVTDVLPSSLTFVSLTAPAGFSCTTPAVGANGTVSCSRSTLPSGASGAFTLVVNVGSSTAAGTVIGNTATISTTSSEVSTTNNASTQNTTVSTSADVSIVKTAASTVVAGQNISYTITTTNNGPSDAASVAVADTLPSGIAFVSATPSQGSCSGTSTVTCNLGTIANGAGATVTLVVSTNGSTATPVSNTATVSAATSDPSSGNNSSTANTTVTPSADLAVAMTGPSSALPGNLVYTATVTNNGPSSAANVTLSDISSAGLTLVSAAPSQGSCSGTTTVSCTLGTLASGASAQVTITWSMPVGYSGGNVTNTASATTSTSDPVSGNNASTVVTTFGCGVVSFTPAAFGLGVVNQAFSQTLALTSGSAPATFAITAGTLPPGLSLSGATVSGTPTQRGAFPVTIGATDSVGCVGSVTYTMAVSRERLWAVGAGQGDLPVARTFIGTAATPRTAGNAYSPAFMGGVSVAMGDTNGDGVADLITGAGPTGGPHVRVFDGATSAVLLSFFAYDAGVLTGIEVAAGDVNGDGFADIITAPRTGTSGHIRAFDGRNANVLRDFLVTGFGAADGLRVAAGDVTGDGWAEIVVGAGPGGPPLVHVVSGTTNTLVRAIMPYAAEFIGGVNVAAGDVTGDGKADIVTGAGPDGGPHVRVFDGTTGDPISGPLSSFFAFAAEFKGGVRVAAGDMTGDGKAELLVVPASGGQATVRIFDGATGTEAAAVLALDPSFVFGASIAVAIPQNRLLVDAPQPNAIVTSPFHVTGWITEETALPGAGADLVHVWAFPVSGAPQFAGMALVNLNRGDIASLFGGEHLRSGFDVTATLAPGTYNLVVYGHNATTQTFDLVKVVRVVVN